MRSFKLKTSLDKIEFNIIGDLLVVLLIISSILPLLLVVVGSFSDNASVVKYGFSIWPREFSLEAYHTAFKAPALMINAYRTSIIITVTGTIILLLMSSMTGYVLSRKDYRYRNVISFYFFFTTIFGGGLVPWYILCVRFLHFKEHSLMAMILPGLFSYFYIIIMRSFMTSIPDSISESAKIDGANDFMIFIRLILPLSKPILATIGLFGALGYWNDWFNAMLFVNNRDYFPLQYFLYTTLNTMNALNEISAKSGIMLKDMPTSTFKLAMTVVTIGPIILLYPFLQKYFISGITVGAVKG